MIYRRAYSRRKFISKYVCASTVFLGVGLLLGSCDRKKTVQENKSNAATRVDPCSNLSGVSENDIALRQKLGYVKESPIPDNRCNNCNLYLPPGADKDCGRCMLFKGPVYPSGYCTYWAPRV